MLDGGSPAGLEGCTCQDSAVQIKQFILQQGIGLLNRGQVVIGIDKVTHETVLKIGSWSGLFNREERRCQCEATGLFKSFESKPGALGLLPYCNVRQEFSLHMRVRHRCVH